MKILLLPALLTILAVLTGCANNSPYYYGGTSYRMNNIGGLPISGSIGVHATAKGLMLSPNIVLSPQYVDWKKQTIKKTQNGQPAGLLSSPFYRERIR